MSSMTVLNTAIEKKLRNLHCGYLGKVLATDGVTAKVQPLGLLQNPDGTTRAQAVVDDVPIACRYKVTSRTIAYKDNDGIMQEMDLAVTAALDVGDLVVCLCADWNISAARNGKNELPPAGRHNISDSIIVGIL